MSNEDHYRSGVEASIWLETEKKEDLVIRAIEADLKPLNNAFTCVEEDNHSGELEICDGHGNGQE